MAKVPASQGLQWKKVDLHVHSPASHDYSGPPVNAEQFVAAVVAKGLHAIAITDHNSGAFIDEAVAAAKKTSLTVFPGVEISVTGGKGGIHMIAIFDPSASSKTIVGLLARVGIPESSFGEATAVSNLGPEAVAKMIVDAGGLAILAHADSSKGVLHDMEGMQRTLVMNSKAVSAIEASNAQKYSKLLDGTDQHYRRKLAVYRSSDNPNPETGSGHSVEGVASRFSWFKVDGLSLASLRQVFADPDVRIKCDTDSATEPEIDNPRIISVEISQGYLAGAKIDLHKGLNSIIGGKGVGKSLIVEFIRFALDQESPSDEIAEDMWGKLDEQLGLGGSVSVLAQLSTGKIIRVTRIYDGEENPITVINQSTGKAIAGDIAQLFPVMAYSQTESLLIARDGGAQLALIDSFLDLAPIEARIRMIEKQLDESDRALAAALRAAATLETTDREVATLREKIQGLETVLKSPELDSLKNLEPKTEEIAALKSVLEEVGDLLNGLEDSILEIEVPALDSGLASDADLKAIRSTVSAGLKDLATKARKLEESYRSVENQVEERAQAWEKHVAAKKADYRKFVGDKGGDPPVLLAKKSALENELKKLLGAAKKDRADAESVQALRTKREELLKQLDAEVESRYDLRRDKYAEIATRSGARLDLSIEKGANLEKYLESLMTLKTGSGLHERTVADVCAKIAPRDLVQFVLSGNVNAIASATGLGVKTVRSLVDRLSSLDDAASLLALEHGGLLQDEPRIRFRKADGNYYALDQLSVGQKCTALLVIALVDGDRPIVIDQPEDALDITSVYEDVTMQLRARKSARQFVVTTHNPTVAVAADTDQFHVLRADANESGIVVVGAIDRATVRDEVIQHLEGGTSSLSLKIRKYGPHSEGAS